ncbi:MAG: adenylate/guanylate cyclase domain-containing protein [Pseudanabaenaceae cyanobacterium SKYGB_i_bin29]|nr:response regulator [Pseudanabaenaceae cyanobacterium SKYG29]MDW8422622.1 adenylate/guanylate cyclase domain-containing protein [Pseudanabaenaceae cyanobacterium SKYGB_i_bin29]
MKAEITPAKILIIDDKPTSIQLLVDLLRRSGYQPTFLTDSSTAMELILREPPDLILLDVVMPGVDGYTLCRQIKGNPSTKDIPVIFISGYGEIIDKVMGFNIGGADYITKPFHSQEVLARIEHHLSLQHLKKDLEAQNQRLQLEVNYRMQAEAELRILLQSMTDIILVYDRWGQHQRTITTNSRFSYRVQENYHRLLAEQFSDYRDFVQIVLNTRDNVCDVEYKLLIDKEEVWFAANISPLEEDSALWVAREITGRKLIESNLTRSNAFLNAQKEVEQDGVLMVDDQGRIIAYNQLFKEMWQVDETLLSSSEHRLITPLLHNSEMPDPLVEAIEAMYQQPEETLRLQTEFSGRIFDCYARSVYSPTGQFYGVCWFFRDITERVQAEVALRVEKEKSERLLLNILPFKIAAKLKEGATTIADSHPDVSVLFADIVGFSQVAYHRSPQEVVSLLNSVFSRFDTLVEKYQLEKIKTIGDEYMAVGGLIGQQPDHLRSAALLALEMLEVIREFRGEEDQTMTLRIGLHTGPVVAGVIGTKKFAYDLWGETVNLASRMQSQGLPGKIQVTETVYRRLQREFQLTYRGEMLIKGHGLMGTFWLEGMK